MAEPPENPAETGSARWLLALTVSALLALPATQQPAGAERERLVERALGLLEQHGDRREFATIAQGHGGGRNGKHAGPHRRAAARARYIGLREAREQLRRKPLKTRADRRALRRIERQVRHWKRIADDAGEHHAQTPKGAPRRRA